MDSVITTDRQAKEAEAGIVELDRALSSDQVWKSVVAGLPPEVVDGVRRSLATERREMAAALDAYERAKGGEPEPMIRRAEGDPGALLLAARVAKQLSQKELGRRLGLREQQIQRYEAERYRRITLANFQKVAAALGVRVSVEMAREGDAWALPHPAPTAEELRKVVRHARAAGWIAPATPEAEEDAADQLRRHVAEHVLRYGTPSLLRTGLNVVDHDGDWTLLAWKARVTTVAEAVIERSRLSPQSLDYSWLLDLVRSSAHDDGPIRASRMLLDHGIVLVVEPQVPGMRVDGAAFLVDDVPVIGMTIRRDAIDAFWFTLLHEVAHVILHRRTGLAAGFFDEAGIEERDAIEEEADVFASTLLIPPDLWIRSPARIARSPVPIERLARQLEIHPAIVFGRIRMERRDYSLFSGRIGNGLVRNQLLEAAEIA